MLYFRISNKIPREANSAFLTGLQTSLCEYHKYNVQKKGKNQTGWGNKVGFT